MTTITALPDPPSRSDAPATFVSKANAFVAALIGLVTQINTVAGEMVASAAAAAASALAAMASAGAAGTSEINAAASAAASAAAAGSAVYNAGTAYSFPTTVIGSDGAAYRCLGSLISGDNPVTSVTGMWLRILVFPHVMIAVTASAGLSVGRMMGNTTVTNTGAGAEVIHSLPAGFVSAKVRFVVDTAQYVQAKAAGSEVIKYLGASTAGGGYVRSNVPGTAWDLEWVAGGYWAVTSLLGPLKGDE